MIKDTVASRVPGDTTDDMIGGGISLPAMRWALPSTRFLPSPT